MGEDDDGVAAAAVGEIDGGVGAAAVSENDGGVGWRLGSGMWIGELSRRVHICLEASFFLPWAAAHREKEIRMGLRARMNILARNGLA